MLSGLFNKYRAKDLFGDRDRHRYTDIDNFRDKNTQETCKETQIQTSTKSRKMKATGRRK